MTAGWLRRVVWAGGLAAPWVGLAASAAAEPQGSLSILAGPGWRGEGRWSGPTRFAGALQGDVLLGRSRGSDLGAGPFLEVGTLSFGDLRLGAGGRLLWPWWESLPAAVGLGGFGALRAGAWEPGVMGNLFLGSRSYNHHAPYSLTAGVGVGYQHGLGERRERALTVSVQLDLALVALPALALFEAFRSSGEE